MGNIKQIPIRAIPTLIDLKTCIINSGVYAEVFRVYNCSKTPFHVRVKIPPSLKNHAHAYPRTTIIQPRNSSVFSVKIYPRVTLSKDAPRYYDENSGILEFPVRIHAAKVSDCSKDYIEIYVHALITTYDLELSPSFIDFGTVSTLETVRTKVELTNHSLVTQEFAFLNLPKGLRVEPNMGFGTILPMETITLFVLFSPVANLCKKDFGEEEVEFDIIVTSIANYGGFREKLMTETNQQPEWKVDEYEGKTLQYVGELSFVSVEESQSNDERKELEPEEEREEREEEKEEEKEGEKGENEGEKEGEKEEEKNEENERKDESSDSDFCDDFSIEGEELTSKISQQENKIRNFLRSKDDRFTKVNLQSEDNNKDTPQTLSVTGEHEENNFQEILRSDMNKLKCRARIVIPRCQMSETVIQLPATPYKCFSLYRVKLIAINYNSESICKCRFRNMGKGCDISENFAATFEFLYSDPQIKLEPGSGHLKAGEYVPVTIIFKPEVDESLQESSTSYASHGIREKFSKKSSNFFKNSAGIKHSRQIKNHETSKGRRGTEDADTSEVKMLSLNQTTKSDSFESTSTPEMSEPFSFETKVRCVIKTLSYEDEIEMTEVHDIALICPAIRRDFNYLGRTEEITFGKVPVGMRSQIILHFQNVSSERLSPSLTLLNPAGPFICNGNFNKVDIDPEHIWRQPLIFHPMENKVNSQYFEVSFGHTNMLLKVVGEAVAPRYDIQPSFGCCLLESKPGAVEEIKLEIINLSPVDLPFQMETTCTKEGVDLQTDKEKEEAKDTKKRYRLWDTTPEVIINSLKNFEESNVNVFTLVGVDAGHKCVIPSNEANQIKIQFWPPKESNDKKYAVKYNLTLGRRLFLKEMIILGRSLK